MASYFDAFAAAAAAGLSDLQGLRGGLDAVEDRTQDTLRFGVLISALLIAVVLEADVRLPPSRTPNFPY